jgi:hypothetical protein
MSHWICCQIVESLNNSEVMEGGVPALSQGTVETSSESD